MGCMKHIRKQPGKDGSRWWKQTGQKSYTKAICWCLIMILSGAMEPIRSIFCHWSKIPVRQRTLRKWKMGTGACWKQTYPFWLRASHGGVGWEGKILYGKRQHRKWSHAPITVIADRKGKSFSTWIQGNAIIWMKWISLRGSVEKQKSSGNPYFKNIWKMGMVCFPMGNGGSLKVRA